VQKTNMYDRILLILFKRYTQSKKWKITNIQYMENKIGIDDIN